ncbi:MAG: MBL fold metallo-hydrolase [Chloroflexota bacterium]|nr:MBL fold metallo-hydrolase [Chloroflexota bacterium]
MQRVAPNVYVETVWPGINVGAVITSEGIILVDAPLIPEEARRWQEGLSTICDQPIIYLVNTDFHPDRVVGNRWFNVPIVAHEKVWDKAHSYGNGFRQQLIDSLEEKYPQAVREMVTWKIALPQITFTGRLTLFKGSETIELIHANGATPSSSLVYLPETQVLFTGDTVVAGTHPLAAQANSKQWLEALNTIRKMKVEHIVPGRGPVGDKQDTHPVSEYIRQLRARVRQLYQAGRSKSETSVLVSEFLEHFPTPDGQRDAIRARVKGSLDRVFEEMKASRDET